MKSLNTPNIEIEEINCHINDQIFADRVLDVFDDWIEKGIILK